MPGGEGTEIVPAGVNMLMEAVSLAHFMSSTVNRPFPWATADGVERRFLSFTKSFSASRA